MPYDSQEEVYKSMFKELSDAIEVLTKYADNGNSNSCQMLMLSMQVTFTSGLSMLTL